MDFKNFNANTRNELKKDSQFANGVIVGTTTDIFGDKAYNVRVIYGNNLIASHSSLNSEILLKVPVKGINDNEQVSLEEGDNVIISFINKDSNYPIIISGNAATTNSSTPLGDGGDSPSNNPVDTNTSNMNLENINVDSKGWCNPFLPEGWVITTAYKKKGSWSAGYHTGIDFGISGGCAGKSIIAACSGKILTAGWGGSYGNHVIIDHSTTSGKVYTLYAHMESLNVTAGQMVSAGQTLGKCGNTGNSYGAHLHFEVRKTNKYADVDDPLNYIPFSRDSNYQY